MALLLGSVNSGFEVFVHRGDLFRLCLRMLAICAVVSVVTVLAQRELMACLLPCFNVIIRLLQSDFVASPRAVEMHNEWMIQMTPFLLRAVSLSDQLALRRFVELPPFFVGVNHALVPLVLLITAVASWPFASSREAAVRALLTLLGLPLVVALTTPLLLVARVQMWIVELALQHGAGSREPALVSAAIFMESGGRWLLPLTVAIACVAVSKRLCVGGAVHPLKGRRPSTFARPVKVVFAPVCVEAVEMPPGVR